MICSHCSASRESGTRLPGGWKRSGEEIFCGSCWKDRHVLRACIIPVASPVDLSWEDLRVILKSMWAETTACSNWMIRQLLMADTVRRPGDSKMPRMPKTYLYPQARNLFPNLTPQSVTSIEQAVTRKYRKMRYDLIWRLGVSAPSFRYPQPFPVHNQSWSASVDEGGRPIVSTRIGEGRHLLRLSGAHGFRLQRRDFLMIVEGKATAGELALYEAGDKIMCKMVAWFPRIARRGTVDGKILKVSTSGCGAMLCAIDRDRDQPWLYHADHVRRWAAEHAKQLQSWADDSKAEDRPRPRFGQRRRDAAAKYHSRMSTAADEAAMFIVGYATRRKFAAIEYNDSDHSWLDKFIWFRLAQRIATLCDVQGIRFVVASGEAEEKDQEPLAEVESS